jgi:hypothetical protein
MHKKYDAVSLIICLLRYLRGGQATLRQRTLFTNRTIERVSIPHGKNKINKKPHFCISRHSSPLSIPEVNHGCLRGALNDQRVFERALQEIFPSRYNSPYPLSRLLTLISCVV